MRRKRLNHTAHILCDMFCGWRLMNSFHDLERLGSGILEIDAITGHCVFDGKEIPQLSIAYELNGWLREDFEKNHIQVSSVVSARLCVVIEIDISPVNNVSQRSFYIGKDGKPVEKGNFYKLVAKLRSEVKTDEAEYKAERVYYESWPVGWPDT